MVSKPLAPPSVLADALRLAEVDVAGELAHDQEVEARHHLGLAATRRPRAPGRPAPGAGWRTGRAPCAGRGSPAPGAWRSAGRRTSGRRPRRTGSHRPASPAQASLPAADRRARRSPRRRPAPPRTRTPSSSFFEDAQRLRNDLRPDAVTGQNGDFHVLEIPGELRLAPRLEGADLVGVAQREADLVEAVEQASACGTGRRRSGTSSRRRRSTRSAVQVDTQPEPGKAKPPRRTACRPPTSRAPPAGSRS